MQKVGESTPSDLERPAYRTHLGCANSHLSGPKDLMQTQSRLSAATLDGQQIGSAIRRLVTRGRGSRPRSSGEGVSPAIVLDRQLAGPADGLA